METKRENLFAEMNKIEVSPEVLAAMNELAYTAAETEMLPFRFHDDYDLAAMVKLVHLAEKYRNGVPDSLRM